MALSPADSDRLDRVLVARGLVESRSRAGDLIRRGLVTVGGSVATKTGAMVPDTAVIGIAEGAATQVSRGAVKLAAALDHFGLSPMGLVALDIGASTGGFTEVLLVHGAVKVYAVDTGHGQLHARLKDDGRVVPLERQDARTLTPVLVPDPVGTVTADVSFISLTLALPVPLSLVAPGGWLVGLIKPQFELSPAAIGKGGIVKHAADRQAAVTRVTDFLAARPGWRVLGVMPSPIAGGSGNAEFLIAARLDA